MTSTLRWGWMVSTTPRPLYPRRKDPVPIADLSIDGRIILRWIFKKRDGGGGGMDWIDLTQNRDRWRALLNAVKNFWVP